MLHILVYAASETCGISDGAAAKCGDAVRRLVAAGADLEVSSSTAPPLHIALFQYMRSGAQCAALLAIVEALLDLGASVGVAPGTDGHTAFASLVAVPRCDLDPSRFRQLVLRLAAAGADVNALHPQGHSPLAMLLVAALNRTSSLDGAGGFLAPLPALLAPLVEVGVDLTAAQPLPVLHIVVEVAIRLPEPPPYNSSTPHGMIRCAGRRQTRSLGLHPGLLACGAACGLPP